MSPNRRISRPLRPAPPQQRHRLKHLLTVVVVVVAAGIFVWFTIPNADQKRAGSKETVATFDKALYSVGDPASPWVVVNKKRPLNPADYAPSSVVAPAISLRLNATNEEMQLSAAMVPALEELVAGAKQAGLELMLASGYRSYAFQKDLHSSYVSELGQTEADNTSARAGYSEHQTGLAADLEPASRQCEIETCFGQLPEGQWLAANGWQYGFIIRYPAGAEALTGYAYEPWHLRYVGKELAAEMHEQGIGTLEEFFGLPGGPDY